MEKPFESTISNSLHEPDLNVLHSQVNEWLSTLEFYNTELHFLQKLLDNSFLRAVTRKQLNELTAMENKVKSFREENLNTLRNTLLKHERHLSSLDEYFVSPKTKTIGAEHETLRSEVKSFMDKANAIKQEIFIYVEAQLKLSKKITADFEDGSMVL